MSSDKPHILVVEDDNELGMLLQERIADTGCRCTLVGDGGRAIETILNENPTLVVLDLMLPVADGFTVCRRVRPQYKGGILMLTARDSDLDQIEGLELGADDYVTKPVRTRVLLARIEALLRRTQTEASATTSKELQLGPLSIDASRREVMLDGKMLVLTTTEFDLLYYLAERSGTVVSREVLYRELAGVEYDGLDRAMDVHVSRLRQKLGDAAKHAQWIKTVRGVGYQFALPR